MDKNQILHIRKELERFLSSDDKYFEFDVTVELKDRINFIYAVIFPGLTRIKFYLRFLIARLAQYIDYSPIKVLLYRSIGIKIGKGVYLSPDVLLDPHFPALIEIDDYCILGWGVKLFSHEFAHQRYRLGRIKIETGVTIGGSAMIRNGVRIGKMVDIPYGSYIYKDIATNEESFEIVKSHLKKKEL